MNFLLRRLSGARLRTGLAVSTLALAAVAAGSAQGQEPVPDAGGEAIVLKIDPPKTEWAYVRGDFGTSGTQIFDGTTGKMRGMVETSASSDMAFDPTGKYYYVSETIWSKGDRGTRQDLVSIYDSTELKLQAEIVMPGRLLIGGRKQNFIVSDDGKTAFIYNFDPQSSVNVIDLARRKFVRAIELPGCASLIPNPGVGFSALCGDGSIATVDVAGGKGTITHTAPFFPVSEDPIFDNFTYDPARREATMLSYTGLIYQVKMGAKPEISAPWSLQEAAGVPKGDTRPLAVNWLPGGFQPMALNRKTGRLYVLMHKGEYWSHKKEGEEVWEIDLAAKKVVKRVPLETPALHIEVTQSAEPLLFLNERGGTLFVLDAKSWEEKHKVESAGSGLIFSFLPG